MPTMFLTNFNHVAAFLCVLLAASQVMGQCVSIQSGPWNDPLTWSCGDPGISRVPLCTDVPITIAEGHTVAIEVQQVYDCEANYMVIIVEGTLSFETGNKLRLPAGSFVGGNGSILAPLNGQGNSSLIEIGGDVVWNAGDGDIPGPFQFPENHPLPIKLLSFDGNSGLDAVHFNWTVAAEVNNDYFTIERSQDLVTWSVVHIQSGSGTSNVVRTYYGDDDFPEKRLMYYRLIQTDFDGTREAFEPIAINFGNDSQKEHKPILFPNPLNLSEGTTFFIKNLDDDIIHISISDLSGHSVQEIHQSDISENGGSFEIDDESFHPGVYLVKVESNSRVQSAKLLIQ